MQKNKVIVALGDSITYGYPYTPMVSWAEELKNVTGCKVINSGVPGDTFADMLLRLEDDVFLYKPDIVTVMGGTNDVYVGYSQLQMQMNFKEVSDKIKEKKANVVIGLPLPVDDSSEGSLQKWRQWLLEYAENQHIPVIDFYSDFVDEQGKIKEELLVDGCHPNKEGYRVMGMRVITFFKTKSRN